MNDLQVIILAGGNSRRMGQDKAMLSFQDQTFLERIIAVSETISKQIMIIGSKKEYKAFRYPVYEDILPNCGPAGGIHSGLSHSEKNYNLVLSCDLPLIDQTVLLALINEYQETEALVCREKERIHPLIGIYNRKALSKIDAVLQEGKRKMTDLLEALNTAYFDVLEEWSSALRNVNTPEEFEALKHGN